MNKEQNRYVIEKPFESCLKKFKATKGNDTTTTKSSHILFFSFKIMGLFANWRARLATRRASQTIAVVQARWSETRRRAASHFHIGDVNITLGGGIRSSGYLA